MGHDPRRGRRHAHRHRPSSSPSAASRPASPTAPACPSGLHVPRLVPPRTRVPAGSVGLAGEFTGVYPTASPGGLAAARRHRPHALGRRRPSRPRCWPRHPGPLHGGGGEPRSRLEVLDAGRADDGAGRRPAGSGPPRRAPVGLARRAARRGWPTGSSATRTPAVRLRRPAACSSASAAGCACATRTALTVAVTGAPCESRVDGTRRSRTPSPSPSRPARRCVLGATDLRGPVLRRRGRRRPGPAGARVAVHRHPVGPRAAAAGRRATSCRSGRAPDRRAPSTPRVAPRRRRRPRTRGPCCGVGPGPRADWFVDGLDALARAAAYTVAGEADRIGRPARGTALTRAVTDELPSEGLVLGAVQVPADGRPLVFLRDHPTTGGYPVVAVVDRDDLDRGARSCARGTRSRSVRRDLGLTSG